VIGVVAGVGADTDGDFGPPLTNEPICSEKSRAVAPSPITSITTTTAIIILLFWLSMEVFL
jgi:hypothetical protein